MHRFHWPHKLSCGCVGRMTRVLIGDLVSRDVRDDVVAASCQVLHDHRVRCAYSHVALSKSLYSNLSVRHDRRDGGHTVVGTFVQKLSFLQLRLTPLHPRGRTRQSDGVISQDPTHAQQSSHQLITHPTTLPITEPTMLQSQSCYQGAVVGDTWGRSEPEVCTSQT